MEKAPDRPLIGGRMIQGGAAREARSPSVDQVDQLITGARVVVVAVVSPGIHLRLSTRASDW